MQLTARDILYIATAIITFILVLPVGIAVTFCWFKLSKLAGAKEL